MLFKNLKQNTVDKLTEVGISQREAFRESEILIEFVFGVTKKDLILNPDKEIDSEKLGEFNSLVEKRIKERIPVQYLTHKAYFMGEEFYVDENVLIPRPETEILVEEVLKLPPATKILDIGTGSGCIACLLAKNLPSAQIFACDISKKALKIAELNAENLGVKDKITFIHSDLFENINKDTKFDIIVSNPPYISINEKFDLQPEVTLHEPHQALFVSDEKGISFYEKLAHQSPSRLLASGILAVEIGIFQAEAVVSLFMDAGFAKTTVISDYSGIERVVIAMF